LAEIAGQPKALVVIDILSHLDRIKYLERSKQHCPYVKTMVLEQFLTQHNVTLDANISQMLLKILEQESCNILLQYLIVNIDKGSQDFAKICELKYLSTDNAKPSL
jgi:hypothetical protein